MKSIITALCLTCLFIALFLSCGTREKPAQTAIFTGRVTDTDTTIYLEGVKVFEKSHAQLSTTTDSAGFFRLDGVDLEKHNIYFEKEDYEPQTLPFEYDGNLEHPIITKHVIMKQVGSADTTAEED